MRLYRVKDTRTGKFYRHKYSQFKGGDWVDQDSATIWTKPGGANGAVGSVRERAREDHFVIEVAYLDPKMLNWRTA